jgi:uncharacterized protein YraI
MKKISILIIFAVFMSFALAAEAASAKRMKVQAPKARIYSGPAWYYDVIGTASRGDVLEVRGRSGGWYRVVMEGGKSGYVMVRHMRTASRSARVSRPAAVAALRGVAELGLFARKYAEKHDLDPAELEELMGPAFTAREFKKFKKAMGPHSKMRGLPDEGFSDMERDLGAAVALRMLAEGASGTERARKYVSMVGTAVVEHTPLRDEPFVFIVLESGKVNSFSVPGGYIFITTGALKLIKNEAELAGVLSHEVVHVINRHGMKEVSKQGGRIRAADAMDDLDRELEARGMDQGDKEVEADLESMADGIFEMLIGGRKMADEDESDILGTELAFRGGYVSTGLRDFILSTKGAVTGDAERSYAYREPERRAAAINASVKAKRLFTSKHVDLADRYINNAR